ncbi:hypothetical protein [Tengunoibacter tsumagoiensis]|uniref:Uncharacterized protein n=1 Tax=Tengunoibacter tsumagoiensis TaxID=2014871 RepID=A0A402A8T2_9CHLR|nr:hypothetical protein [Tengunoibacter tsumagoiensis]GCE15361.1 hypothetical protein KTT_52200 [Tengunoibacter tsumagoiensis]
MTLHNKQNSAQTTGRSQLLAAIQEQTATLLGTLRLYVLRSGVASGPEVPKDQSRANKSRKSPIPLARIDEYLFCETNTYSPYIVLYSQTDPSIKVFEG